jgi:hypothetical protein
MGEDLKQALDEKFFGMWRGKVMDNNDPLLRGRIRVKIIPWFSKLETDQLPWAVPAFSIFCGSGVGSGSFSVPDIDSFVFIFFEAGDLYQPVYFAEAPTALTGIPAQALLNYPQNRVIKTAMGLIIEINDFLLEAKVTHPTGAIMKVGTLGNIQASTPTDVDISAAVANVLADTVNITGNGTINVIGGTINIAGSGTVSIAGGVVAINT